MHTLYSNEGRLDLCLYFHNETFYRMWPPPAPSNGLRVLPAGVYHIRGQLARGCG